MSTWPPDINILLHIAGVGVQPVASRVTGNCTEGERLHRGQLDEQQKRCRSKQSKPGSLSNNVRAFGAQLCHRVRCSMCSADSCSCRVALLCSTHVTHGCIAGL